MIAFCVYRLNFDDFVFKAVEARCRKKILIICAFNLDMKVLAMLY